MGLVTPFAAALLVPRAAELEAPPALRGHFKAVCPPLSNADIWEGVSRSPAHRACSVGRADVGGRGQLTGTPTVPGCLRRQGRAAQSRRSVCVCLPMDFTMELPALRKPRPSTGTWCCT